MQTIGQISTVRGLWSVAVLALAALGSPALAQKAERPGVKVGDRWLFETRLGAAGVKSSDREWVVKSVTPTRIEGTENGQPLVMTPELNNIESPLRKDSDLRLLSFPLAVGKKWSFTDNYVWVMGGIPASAKCSAAVVGYEKVRVPAGEFDAFKLGAKCSRVAEGATGETTYKYWYAPAARAVVKTETRDTSTGLTTVELAEFKLQP
jgi:hypothetical protein